VRCAKIGTPVTSSDGQNAELCDDDCGTNSSCDFLRSLDTETNMALRVADDNDSLESSTLTSTSLFLDWLDLKFQNISYMSSKQAGFAIPGPKSRDL